MSNEYIPKEIEKIAWSFRYFVKKRSYNFIDRITNAVTPEVAIDALKDALRVLRSAYDRGDEDLEYLPSEKEVAKFIEYIKEDISYAKILGSLVFVWTPEDKKIEGGE